MGSKQGVHGQIRHVAAIFDRTVGAVSGTPFAVLNIPISPDMGQATGGGELCDPLPLSVTWRHVLRHLKSAADIPRSPT